MKLQQYFQAYGFDEIFPQIGLMYQKARHQREQFRHAYELLLAINPVSSKKQIRYQLMRDPDTDEMFFGADDNCFKDSWNVLLGKDVKREPKVKLTDEEMVANMLLNTVLLGRHPKEFNQDYKEITK